jgi:hypothetical protein
LNPPKFQRNVWRNIVDASGTFKIKCEARDPPRSKSSVSFALNEEDDKNDDEDDEYDDESDWDEDEDGRSSTDDESQNDFVAASSSSTTAAEQAQCRVQTDAAQVDCPFSQLSNSQMYVVISTAPALSTTDTASFYSSQHSSSKKKQRKNRVQQGVQAFDVEKEASTNPQDKIVRKNFLYRCSTVLIETSDDDFLKQFKLSECETRKIADIKKFLLEHLIWYDDTVLGTICGHEITLSHFKGLLVHRIEKDMWISSAVVDSYLSVLAQPHESVCCVPSTFWAATATVSTQHVAADVWGKFACKSQFTFMPLHVNGNHWILVVIDSVNQELCVYNPIGDTEPRQQIAKLKDRLKRIRQLFPNTALPCIEHFKALHSIKCPPLFQPDNYNCAIVCLLIAEKICTSSTSKVSLTSNDLRLYRDRIMLKLCQSMK